MTWRQVLEGLAELPQALRDIRALQHVASISIASLQADDVIIVETERALTHEGRNNIVKMVKKIWPDQRVAVWDSGLRMRIVRDDRQASDERAEAS